MRTLAFLLLLLGCAHVKDDQTLCAESRGLRCLTRIVCTMDATRGCRTCLCEAAAVEGPDGKPQPAPATDPH